jgi:hypothetical protein
LAFSVLPFLVEPFGVRQPAPDEFDVPLGRGDALFGLFLEGVKNVDNAGELCCIDGTICIRVVPVNDSP